MCTNYVEIGRDYFIRGMYADSDIYYVLDGKPILFCRQTLLTEDTIHRLTDIISRGGRICVSEDGYSKLQEQHDYFSHIKTDTQEHYEAFKDHYKFFLTNTRMTGEVDLQEAARLGHLLSEQFGQVDVSFILQWTSYMRSTDEYLATHSIHVAILNAMMANWLNLSDVEKEKLILIGLLHDIGKIALPEPLLLNACEPTVEESKALQNHPIYSYELLKKSGETDDVLLSGIRGHHEKMNGSGYPDGLASNNIPYYAKITSVSDIYDVMVVRKSYENAESLFEILDEFFRNQFSDLDLQLVDLFLEKLANEMIGKEVLLSNGKMGRIIYTEKSNIAFPIIECGAGNVLQTDANLKCISLCNTIDS